MIYTFHFTKLKTRIFFSFAWTYLSKETENFEFQKVGQGLLSSWICDKTFYQNYSNIDIENSKFDHMPLVS